MKKTLMAQFTLTKSKYFMNKQKEQLNKPSQKTIKIKNLYLIKF